MSKSLSRLRRAVMGVPDRQAIRFIRGNTPEWKHLETVVRSAVGGYHAVLDGSRLDDLIPRLEQSPLEFRGYAYEGAAMGLTGLDLFLPGGSRLRRYIDGPGSPHIYMVHIGAGEALARLRRKPEPFLRRLPDPVLRWLALDGYGFHEGFFKPQKFVTQQRVPAHLSAFGRRVFDQGVGRSIWFASGASVDDITRTIATFPAHRHTDLWLGVGVACGYVGGVGTSAVHALRAAAGRHLPRVAVGTAFVAKGRIRAGNPIPGTSIACEVLCGMPSQDAAEIVDRAWTDLADSPSRPAYGHLQDRLEETFRSRTTASEPYTGGMA